jgi:hypothetical protein
MDTTEITYRHRIWTHEDGHITRIGGYRFERTDNGRDLGWVFKGADGNWRGYIAEGAFRGEGPDDRGDILDRVPAWLFCGRGDGITQEPVSLGYTRDEAAQGVLHRLDYDRAPALGHGRHDAVTPWAERRSVRA